MFFNIFLNKIKSTVYNTLINIRSMERNYRFRGSKVQGSPLMLDVRLIGMFVGNQLLGIMARMAILKCRNVL